MKTRANKRQQRKLKSMEERDDEIPWLLPNASADFKTYNEKNLGSSFNLNMFEEDNQREAGFGGLKRCSPITMDRRNQSIPVPVAYSLPGASVPIPPAPISSEDVCTLFQNSYHVHSVGRRQLPPIGVFWDIENCSIPKGRSALVSIQRIRDRFFPGHYEAEFTCVCDIRKESPDVIQELNDAQVTVVHVSGNSKNAADDKLRQSMRRFTDIYAGQHACPSSPYPATIILISGDINFSSDLSDFRHRKRLYVILLHNKHAPEALKIIAHERYDFHSFLGNLPPRARRDLTDFSTNESTSIPLKGALAPMDLLVCDLPLSSSKNVAAIKNRLKKLSDNCGGKVITLHGSFAVVRFPNKESALRATKRMNGEDVLGARIRVIYSSQMEFQNPEENGSNNSSLITTPRNARVRDLTQGGQEQRQSSSPSWKPTWKNNCSSAKPSDSYITPPRPINASQSFTTPPPLNPETRSFLKPSALQLSTLDASTSSSHESTNQEDSPKENKTAAAQVFSVHSSTPLNNRIPSRSQPQINESRISCGSGKSNLGITTANNQCKNFQENNELATPIPASASVPRLYSAPFATNSSVNQNHAVPVSVDRLSIASSISKTTDCQQLPTAHIVRESCKNVLSKEANFAASSTILLGTPLHQPSVEPHPSQTENSPNNMRMKHHDLDFFDLHVSNVDPNLGDWKVIRHTLMTTFAEHVTVKGVWVYVSQDGAVSAIVRVTNKEEAHFAVAQLHRRKFGSKRIFISFDQGANVDTETLKKEVASLLLDVPGSSLPFFKFREMFEKRYRRSVSSSDLYRLKDVVSISEGSSTSGFSLGRTISLCHDWKATDGKHLSIYCPQHPPKIDASKLRAGWAEKEAEVLLPNVMIELKTLANRAHSLLNTHNGGVPLISFLDCYEASFCKMDIVDAASGVPLEHLLACVQGVEITCVDNGMKRLQWSNKNPVDAVVAQPLAVQLAQFGREMVDLLKTFPKCTLAFSKLIPAYHHHFGRQCRVADYGHFNLQSLLQTIPHVVQIMGAAQNRLITLSHKAQIKRFITDMLRVLKAHGGVKKQIKVSDFPQVFSQVFPTRQFAPEDYGLCNFSDLISELIENSTLVAVVKDEDGNQMLAVPKREQTPQEIHKTRVFASEGAGDGKLLQTFYKHNYNYRLCNVSAIKVVELFRHSIRYEMPFSKFIPSYHHHFGKQCRVSDYGFTKLAELFEAIPDTVLLIGGQGPSSDCCTEDKVIRLVPQEQIKVVGEQLGKLIQKQTEMGKRVLLEEVEELFVEEHGFQLRPEMCDAETIDDLVTNMLTSYLKIEEGFVYAIDQKELEVLMEDITAILQTDPQFKMDLDTFLRKFEEAYNNSLSVEMIEGQLGHLLTLSDPLENEGKRTITLVPLRRFAHEIVQILQDHGGSVATSQIEFEYLQKYGRPIRPATMGFPSLNALLEAIPEAIQLRGKNRPKRIFLAGIEGSEGGSFEESLRCNKSRYSDPRPGPAGANNAYYSRPYSEHRQPFTHLKNENSCRWTESPQPQRSRATAPLTMYPQPLGSPVLYPPRIQTEPSIFTFERSGPMSPPIYDMWMRDSISPGSPPVSPPVVWTYHPIVYPPNTPPSNPPNIMMPAFSYGGQWSPAIPGCYERMAAPPGNGAHMGHGQEFAFGDHNGMECIGDENDA